MRQPDWQTSDGAIRLYCGDCLELLPGLGREADVLIADPPYNFSTSSSGNKFDMWADTVNASLWFREALRASTVALKRTAAIWWFLNWRTLPSLQKASCELQQKIESLLIWDKCWIGPGGSRGLRPSYECVAFFALGDFALPDRGLPDIWKSQWSSQRPNGHPAEKPLGLIQKLVSVTPGGIVLDPFMGSGTSGVAAMKEGRQFIGIELDARYFDIACKRIEAELTRHPLLEDKPTILQKELIA